MRTQRRLGLRGAVARKVSLLATASVLVLTGPAMAASPVSDAARVGDLDELRALIENGADVDAVANDGSTAILWAAYQSDLDMLEALIAAGADANAANDYGVTPLLQASSTGDTGVMAALLSGGADVERAHPDGATPLMAAARTGNVGAVRLLLEHGADPNAKDSFQEQTALMWAAAEGHLEVVDVLLNAGADPNMQAHINVLTERKNADFPSGGFTAVMWAARNGYPEIVKRLVEAGADLDTTNGDGATATMISIVNDRFDMAAMLVELGASVNDGSLYQAVDMRDATTDWYARDGSKLRNNFDNELTALDLIGVLLDAGADPNQPFAGQMHSTTMCCDTKANATPFYRAAIAADVEAMKLMLEHGADLAWMPESIEGGGPGNRNAGKTALLVAMNGGKGVPLSAGPGYSREGPPPFREISNRNPADAVALLLRAGADADVLGPDGNAALHDVVVSRKADIIRALAEGGATLDLPNKKGETPLYLALNAEPDVDTGPFGPRPDRGDATIEEIATLVHDLMVERGYDVEAAAAPPPESAAD